MNLHDINARITRAIAASKRMDGLIEGVMAGTEFRLAFSLQRAFTASSLESE